MGRGGLERTNGKLKVEVFPSAQLGVEEDILEQIRQGANVGQNTDSARLGNYVPDIAVMNAPYFVETLEEVQKLATLPTVKAWKDQLEEKQGFKILSFFWVQGFRQMITNKPIKSPADLAGLRIRTPPAPIWQESDPRHRRHARGDGLRRHVPGHAEQGHRRRRAVVHRRLQREVPRGGEVRVRDPAHPADQLRGHQQQVVQLAAGRVPEDPRGGVQQGRASRSRGTTSRCSTCRTCKNLKDKGMTFIPASEIDMAAFKAAGEKAYQKLNLVAARDKIYKELGKKK